MARDAVVDLLDAVADGGIELGEREECALTELRDDPSGGDLHPDFHFGLIFGFIRTCWDNCGGVMLGHLLVCAIDVWLVEAGLGDARLEIVADDHRRHTAKVAEGASVRAEPSGELLWPGRFRGGQ